jgi:hypothetical protein
MYYLPIFTSVFFGFCYENKGYGLSVDKIDVDAGTGYSGLLLWSDRCLRFHCLQFR